jgi:putative DNA primase/helicase
MRGDGTYQAPPAALEVAETVDRDKRAEEIRKVLRKLEQKHDRNGNPVGPKKSLVNLDNIVKDDPFFCRRLKYNGLSERVEYDGERLTDQHTYRVQMAIGRTYGLEYSEAAVSACLAETAMQRTYHPVHRFLTRIRWDGVPRIDRYLVDCIGAEDTPLHRAISRRWFVSCVARAMGRGKEPVKVDTVLILAGPQGARKSTSFRTLAGADWFSDTALDLRNKDSFQTIRGVWLYELAELAATRPRDAETVKAFLSAETDRYRPPYARNTVDSHRQVVFVGTTNEASFLSDPTGARRFWPVTVGTIDLERIKRDRTMLWAEAVAAWKAGEPWWLTPEEDKELRDAQEQYKHEDPWQAAIEQWLEMAANRKTARGGLRIADVLVTILEMDTEKHGKHHEMRLGGVLQAMGWYKRQKSRNGVRAWTWFPPE